MGSAGDDPVDGGPGAPSAGYEGRATDGTDLAVTLSEIARGLQDRRGVDETLRAVAAAAVGTVPGADHAAISVTEGRRAVRTVAGTDDLVYRVDQAQYDTGQGPCLDALYHQRTVRLADMASESRWPDFTHRAAGLGVRSMLSFQLYVEHDDLGALNLYAADAHAFDDESEQVGLLFATHAAIAMAGAQKEEQLTRAMAVRDVIGQAKGILVERHKITGDQAFRLLITASQTTNTRLVEVAAYLVETGELLGRTRR
ncbi:MAG TPA: GAF and ANTAR domain-containing protein [Pilimelia sp.]|nr:GAF and ANTAR domain-containing protein [Pilimelia sp.]